MIRPAISFNQFLYLSVCFFLSACFLVANPYVVSNEGDKIVVKEVPIDQKLLNVWPNQEQEAYRERVRHLLEISNKFEGDMTTYGEREKNLYPVSMFMALRGELDKARANLMTEDLEAGKDHEHTLGIDWYWCFTIKGQVRKYFYFGDLLSPEYKKRMFDSAKIWTQSHPRETPHPKYKKYDPTKKDGWGPDRFGNRQVDGRRTDNLWAMSTTTIYLMAEETGNEETRQKALDEIKRYVTALYTIGMGEWDSENYLSHTMAPYVNLYDFAKDPEVKLLAKAALDWFCTAGAMKYWRGSFGGPIKRDYGNIEPWGANVIHPLELYFGDSPTPNPYGDRDDIHHITSMYRPPMATVQLARKNFKKPVEILVSHPTYENWKDGGSDKPEFHETQYFGNTYQIGTLPRANEGDANGFKMLAFNSKTGADYVIVSPTSEFKNSKSFVTARQGNPQIAHYENLVIWINDQENADYTMMLPPETVMAEEKGISFFQLEKTWLAFHPIALEVKGMSQQDIKGRQGSLKQQFFKAKGKGKYSGFVLEIGEKESHGSFDEFKQLVILKSKLDLAQSPKGIVSYKSAEGKSVGIEHGASMPVVIRNGKKHDWKNHYALYQNADGSKAPIHLGWKEGELTVEAGGQKFEGKLSADGKYTFTNQP